MALEVTKLTRVFIYNGAELADLNSALKPADIAEAYSGAYPELTNISIEGPVIKGDKAIYTFYKAAGGKG